MKTFETEKHNIPEGATHYSDESDTDVFAWFKSELGVNYIWCPGIDVEEYWISLVDQCVMHGEDVKPIPQTNIETPEEKEVLDSINSNLIKPREPSKPVITKVEWGGAGLPAVGIECWFNFKSRAPEKCTVKYIGDKICVYDDESGKEYSILLSSVEFSRIETEAERVERDRMENGKALHSQASKTEVATEFGIFRLWEMEDKETRDHYCQLAERINYRKEG